MKRFAIAFLTIAVVFTLIAFDLPRHMGPRSAAACGWGDGGGQGYVPQRQDQNYAYAVRPALTEDQARELITQHVTKLNPELTVGPLNDAGEFFEAEILSKDNEVVQIIGVDKRSGRLALLN